MTTAVAVVQRYRVQQQTLAERTARRAGDTVRGIADLDPDRTTDETVHLLSTFIGGACLSASILSDAWLAGLLHVRPLGLVLPDPTARLAEAIALILSSEPTARVFRVERLARSEPEQAARQTATTAMQRHGIERYRWELDSDPCEQCQALAAQTWPISTPAVSHPNCSCVPVPITS